MADYLDTYLVDGVDLRSLATRIEVAEDLQTAPEPIGGDIVVPGMDGELMVFGGSGQPRRPDGPGRITFTMSLAGVNPATGAFAPGVDTATKYFDQWDTLVRLFSSRTLQVAHPRPGGQPTRYTTARLLERLAPSREPFSPWFGKFRAVLAIPGGHWVESSTVTTGPTSLTTGQALNLSAFSAATAPCTELLLRFGPGSNPRLQTSYGFFQWGGVISAGRELLVDTATGLISSGAGTAWTPGYGAELSYSPGPRYFEVDPSETLSATLTHTGGGTMSVEVSGVRRYRTS